jgi:hypothetical protein
MRRCRRVGPVVVVVVGSAEAGQCVARMVAVGRSGCMSVSCDGGRGAHSLARLVSKASVARLAAAQDVSGQGLAAVEAAGRVGRPPPRRRAQPERRFDQRPAGTDPVAIAGVDELVGPAGESSLGGMLPGREPRD